MVAENFSTLSAENMDHRRMRNHNSRQILSIVRKLGPVSRADITRQTPYSAPTVSALISGLVRAGLVNEEGEGKSSGGRKPQLLSFNAQCGVVIGSNIDSDAIQIVLADMTGKWLRKKSIQLQSETRPRPLLRRLATAIEGMLKDPGFEATPLLAVAVGVPGMTDVSTGTVIEAANLDEWRDVPVQEILQGFLSVPVKVENDVNLAAIGEQWHGGGRGVENFVFISVGTGIGAGIIIDGKLHRGHRWHAGEISHLNVDYRKWSTDYAAAGYLEAHLRDGVRQKAKAAEFSFDKETVRRLGAAVANIATIIDPETVVVGGHLIMMDPESLPQIFEVAARIAPNCPRLYRTELGEDAPLLGSVQIALQYADENLHDLMMEAGQALEV
jgi:glucokinase